MKAAMSFALQSHNPLAHNPLVDLPYVLFKSLVSGVNLMILTFTVITSSTLVAVVMLMFISWIEAVLDLRPSDEELYAE